ncbi:DUF1254 domain-containing protein [Temperatibacter marinus]|uniref:DUF1254 domain-containing protein n=1 Tax=Temperatibacter marinus TaxID=1456591 RepID=A0AA52EJJ0_9PROT|nr:DUF1254 domain-containing protein [Temperatibacter marinus]WND03434.1 DUF1254 domain-containing protein [Temperatibacter marinus]
MKYTLLAMTTAVCVCLLSLAFAPDIIMMVAMKGLIDRSQAINPQAGYNMILIPTERTSHLNQPVVRPSNDMLYAVCVFDLSKAPDGLLISAPIQDGYISLSAFASNSDNFYVQDDRGFEGDLKIQLVSDKVATPVAGHTAVVSPSEQGIVLVRLLIEDETQLAAYFTQINQATCKPA